MCKRTEEAKRALNERLDAYETRERLAARLNINSAHIYKLFAAGNLTPTLDAVMTKNGWLPARPTRIRLPIDCDRETREWFRDETARRNMTGEDFLLYMRRCMEREEGRT